jgi:L-ribulokinase
MIGLEAGQSAFGDAYAWFKNILAWPLQNILSQSANINIDTAKNLIKEVEEMIIPELSKQAEQLLLEINNESAMDWLNGRRTPDADQLLKGGFTGLALGTDAPRMFRALVEATCFGAKKIVDRFNEQDVQVKGLIGLGGVARKSSFIMQMMADIMNMPIRIHKSEQTCAAGAAMFAATAAGVYPKVELAMQAMGQGFDMLYLPDKNKSAIYNLRYQQYNNFGAFIEQQTKPLPTKAITSAKTFNPTVIYE